MDERRRSTRKRLKKSVTVVNMDSGETVGELIDITPEGMLIKSALAIKEDISMELRLLMPVKIFGKDMLDVDACCVWSRASDDNSGILGGFEFVNVDPQVVGIIIGLILDLGIDEEEEQKDRE